MPQTTGTTKLAADLPTELVEDFRERAKAQGGVTAVLLRFAEKFCGRKPSNILRKVGRPKKVGGK